MRRRSSRHKGYQPPIDSLGTCQSVTWIVATDQWGRMVESRRLDPGTALFEVLLAESLRYHRIGWSLTDRPFFNRKFYVRRPGQPQLCVQFTSANPELQPLEAEGRYDQHGFSANFSCASAYQ